MPSAEYFLEVPRAGSNYWLTIAVPVFFLTIAVAAASVVRYSRSPATRTRLRALRKGSLLAAVLLGLHAVLRSIGAPALSYRLVFYLIAVPAVLWLAWWALSLRSLPHDLVVERERRRSGGYLRRGRRRR